MKPWERRTFNLLSLAVLATGLAYFWMKYAMQADDPFAVVNHPWQGLMLHAHLLVSPPFILVSGMILNSHIIKKLRATRMANRKSGLTSLATFAAMVVSGYLLQVATSEPWLRALVIVHVTSGVVFGLAYGAHLISSARLTRRAPLVSGAREVA